MALVAYDLEANGMSFLAEAESTHKFSTDDKDLFTMISGIKLKDCTKGKVNDVIFETDVYAGSLPVKIADGLEALLFKLTAQSGKELAVALHNRVAMARSAHERTKSLFGRIVNKLSLEKWLAILK